MEIGTARRVWHAAIPDGDIDGSKCLVLSSRENNFIRCLRIHTHESKEYVVESDVIAALTECRSKTDADYCGPDKDDSGLHSYWKRVLKENKEGREWDERKIAERKAMEGQ